MQQSPTKSTNFPRKNIQTEKKTHVLLSYVMFENNCYHFRSKNKKKRRTAIFHDAVKYLQKLVMRILPSLPLAFFQRNFNQREKSNERKEKENVERENAIILTLVRTSNTEIKKSFY
jgi:hypothetical protein